MASLFDSAVFNKNLFFPRPEARRLPPGSRELRVEVAPGVSLECRVHPSPSARVAVLFFTGNGETAADWDSFASAFHRLGAALIVVSYRGYGTSGGSPTLRAVLADATVVAAAVSGALREAGAPLPLVAMGRSLGSASAAEIAGAASSPCAGVVIESGFSDLPALVARRGLTIPVPLSAQDLATFSPLGKLARSRLPLLLLHGAADTLIPPADAEASLAAAGSPDRSLVVIEDRGHNDLMYSEAYWTALGAFLTRILGHRTEVPVHLPWPKARVDRANPDSVRGFGRTKEPTPRQGARETRAWRGQRGCTGLQSGVTDSQRAREREAGDAGG